MNYRLQWTVRGLSRMRGYTLTRFIKCSCGLTEKTNCRRKITRLIVSNNIINCWTFIWLRWISFINVIICSDSFFFIVGVLIWQLQVSVPADCKNFFSLHPLLVSPYLPEQKVSDFIRFFSDSVFFSIFRCLNCWFLKCFETLLYSWVLSKSHLFFLVLNVQLKLVDCLLVVTPKSFLSRQSHPYMKTTKNPV